MFVNLLISASKISISGAPRPTFVEGPGWSSPGHVQDLKELYEQKTEGSKDMKPTKDAGQITMITHYCTCLVMHPNEEQLQGLFRWPMFGSGKCRRRMSRTCRNRSMRISKGESCNSRIWPDPIGRCRVAWSAEITHRPYTRPL